MARFPFWRSATAGKALMAVLALYVVVYAIVGYTALPLGALVTPQMRATYVAHSVGIYGHIVGAVVALLIGPFQFSTRLRNARPNVHRWMGRVYLGFGVLCGALFGLYMSQFAYGGAVARSGSRRSRCAGCTPARVRISRFAAARSRSTANGWCATSR